MGADVARGGALPKLSPPQKGIAVRAASYSVIAIVGAILIAGCASGPGLSSAEMMRARTLIDQAEKANTREFAASELEFARDKLNRAERAAQEGREAEAERLAMQAALDAEYATAKAGSSEAEKAAVELDRSLETLRHESTSRPIP